MPFKASARFNEQPNPSTTSASASLPAELSIHIERDYYAEYRGTRAQLEAEGLIPAVFTWPERKHWSTWSAAGCEFDLHRCRPEGMKGPAKLWVNGDFWALRIVPQRFPMSDSHIRRKARELRDAIYLDTSEGRRRLVNTWEASNRARKDMAFQAFKARIPALCEPPRARRGRKAEPSRETGNE